MIFTPLTYMRTNKNEEQYKPLLYYVFIAEYSYFKHSGISINILSFKIKLFKSFFKRSVFGKVLVPLNTRRKNETEHSLAVIFFAETG